MRPPRRSVFVIYCEKEPFGGLADLTVPGALLHLCFAQFYLGYSYFKCNSVLMALFCINKIKLSHYTPWRRLGERRYSSYPFMSPALDGGERSASRPVRASAPGKGPPVPTGQEAGWVPELVWTQRLEENSSCLCWGSNSDHPVVQSVVRYYSD
jgi:hypothetical protein